MRPLMCLCALALFTFLGLAQRGVGLDKQWRQFNNNRRYRECLRDWRTAGLKDLHSYTGYTWIEFEDWCSEKVGDQASPRYWTEREAEAAGVFKIDGTGGTGGIGDDGAVEPPDASFFGREPSRSRQRFPNRGRVMLNNVLESVKTMWPRILKYMKPSGFGPTSPGSKPRPAPVPKPIPVLVP